jgi:hypothetical protein
MREKGLYSILIMFVLLIMGYGCTPQPAGPQWRQVTVHTIATYYCLNNFNCPPASVPLTTQELSYLLPNIFNGKSYGDWGTTTSSFPIEELTYFISPITPLSSISAPTISSPLFLSFSGQTTSDPFISLPISDTNTGVVDYYSWLYFNEGTVAIDNDNLNGNIFYNGIRQVMMYKPDGTTVPVIGLPFSAVEAISNATFLDPVAISLVQSGFPYTIPTTPVSTSGFVTSYTGYDNVLFDPPIGPLFTPPYAFLAIFTIPITPIQTFVFPITFTYTSSDITSMDRTKVLLPPMVKLAVTNNDIIYFAIRNTIYQTSLQSNTITITASLPVSEEVVSMKVDNNSGLVYAASEHLENQCSEGITNCNPNIFTRPVTGYLWKIDPVHHIVTLLVGGSTSWLTPNPTTNQRILPIDIALDSTGRYLFFIDNSARYNDSSNPIIQTGSFIEVLDLKQNKLYFVHGINVPGQKATFTNAYTSYMNLYFTSTATTATLYASIYGEDPDTPETQPSSGVITYSSQNMELYSIETISWPLQ